jgi:hypothetical protein
MVDLSEYFPVVVALVFVFSILYTLFAVRRADDPRVRKSYLAMFFLGLLAVNLVPLSPVLPFSHLHKYTEASSNPTTYYQIYVVDESGDELRYDGDAAPPAGTLIGFGRGIATEYSEPKAESTAEYLLDHAITYRQRIRAGRGIEPYLDFPPHALGYGWDRETLAEHGEFVGLRVYHVELRYTESGLGIEERDRTLVATTTERGELVRNATVR